VADGFKPKPLVDATLVTEFGGVEDMEQFKTEGPFRQDYLYVPGGSDMRYKRDTDLSRLYRGEIRANEVSTMEWNTRWFRAVKGAGADPDNTRPVYAKNQGYKAATKDDVGKPWLTELPPGAIVAADGTIRTSGGDLQLFVADKATAARNAMRKKIKAEESVQGMEFQSGGLGQIGKQHKGADPFVEKTIGTDKGATK
jgi:hypothetical protein